MADEGEISGDEFPCRQCGVCCRTQKIVLLTLPDIFRLANKLGMSPGAFYKKHCLRSDRFNDRGFPRIYLKTEGGCPFLKGDACSVHDVKPIVCAASPFIYLESSLAALRVLGVIVPGCGVDWLPYGTRARGDAGRLIDMEIQVNATDEYTQRYGKFDERSAQEYLELSRESMADPGVRAITYSALLDACVRREDMCRNDPYYRGSTLMYLGGFYREFCREVERERALHPGLYAFEPAALGVVGGTVTIALHAADYREVKKRLAGEVGDVFVRASMRDGIEYATVTIVPKGGAPVICYFYVDGSRKPSIRRVPGKVTIAFENDRGKGFTFTGEDISGWLS